MDDAFYLSAAVQDFTDENSESGCLSLLMYRIRRCFREYGQAYPWRTFIGVGAWHLYQRAGGGTDPFQMGERHLQKYMDRTVSKNV